MPQSTQPSGTTTTKHKTKKEKTGSAEKFLNDWHKAYALVYDKGDYVGGIAVLRAMGYDDNVDVATLIGYASRKLGRYDDAKYWYDKALAADPNHALTWSYYGMWQAEQGNLLKAKDDLEKVRDDLRQHRMPRICRAQGSDRRHQDVLSRFPGAAQHGAKRNDALQTRDRCKLGVQSDPGSAVHRFALHRVRETSFFHSRRAGK